MLSDFGFNTVAVAFFKRKAVTALLTTWLVRSKAINARLLGHASLFALRAGN